jgi:MYXO-CTERM domain-containing protein
VKQLQRRLRVLAPIAYIIEEVGYADGRTTINPDGLMGPHTLGALARVLEDKDTPRDILGAVRSDLQRLAMRFNTTELTGSALNVKTMLACIWIAYHDAESISRLEIPRDGIEGIRWLTMPPDDGANAEQKQCWNPMTDRMPGTFAPVQPAPMPAPLPIAPESSSSPGSTRSSPTSSATSARSSTTDQPESSSSVFPWVVGGLGVAAAGWAIFRRRRR